MPLKLTPPKWVFDQQLQTRRLNPNYLAYLKREMDENTVRKKNRPLPTAGHPYIEWMADQVLQPINAHMALPVISTLSELAECSEWASVADNVSDVASQISTSDTASEIGLPIDQTFLRLTKLMQKYAAPLGLTSRLFLLSKYSLVIVIDDSSSMSQSSDVFDPDFTSRVLSRWEEVHMRLIQFFSFLSLLPVREVVIRFLTRLNEAGSLRAGEPARHIVRKMPGESADAYFQASLGTLRKIFSRPPHGDTPLLRVMQEELAAARGKKVALTVLCDGAPSGGGPEALAITQLLISRPAPENTPICFLTCTGDEAEKQWISEAEQAAPFCAEVDDYATTAQNICGPAGAQGPCMPYTHGVHLVRQLVSALPSCETLDSMDEGVPMTHYELSQFLGYVLDAPGYKHYFRELLRAALARHGAVRPGAVRSELDKLQQAHVEIWKAAFPDFVQTRFSSELPVVQAYFTRVRELKKMGH